MNLASLLIFLVVGAVAGWLAGVIVKGAGYGLFGNLLVGILGAAVGGAAFQLFGVGAGGLGGAVAAAAVGAAVLLAVVGVAARRA